MNTHKLTNKNGESIEFDSAKYPEFMRKYDSGDKTCANTITPYLSCYKCPARETVCDGEEVDRFSLLKVEPLEETFTLLDLTEGEEYELVEDEPYGRYKVVDDDLWVLYPLKPRYQKCTRVLGFKVCTFRKIKKELKFADLSIGDIVTPSSCGEQWKVVDLRENCSRAIVYYAEQIISLGEDQIKNWKKVEG